MKSINYLSKKDMQYIKLIVFDVDGVLVSRGTAIKQNSNKLYMEIKKISKRNIQLIKKLHDLGYCININSGRSLFVLLDMFREVLDYVSITYENGSAIWYRGEVTQYVNSWLMLRDIRNHLMKIKNRNIKGWEPKEFIITIHCSKRVKEIEDYILTFANFYCIWNGEAYDIGIFDMQNKGKGLIRTMITFGFDKSHVMVIGDNYNDVEMLECAGVSVSADETRVKGHYYTPKKKALPATILMNKIIELQE